MKTSVLGIIFNKLVSKSGIEVTFNKLVSKLVNRSIQVFKWSLFLLKIIIIYNKKDFIIILHYYDADISKFIIFTYY